MVFANDGLLGFGFRKVCLYIWPFSFHFPLFSLIKITWRRSVARTSSSPVISSPSLFIWASIYTYLSVDIWNCRFCLSCKNVRVRTYCYLSSRAFRFCPSFHFNLPIELLVFVLALCGGKCRLVNAVELLVFVFWSIEVCYVNKFYFYQFIWV